MLPVVAASINSSCSLVGISVIVISPVCVVTVPAKAATKSEAVPASATEGSLRVIAPVMALFIAFN